MLRTTVAAVGAGLGGADAVTVLPFDAALGLPDDFSRRIARNTQALLLEESHLAARHRPGGRLLVRRVAHRRAGPRRVGRLHDDRGRRRCGSAALDDGSLAAALDDDLDPPRGAHRPPPGPDHRRQRVPEPRRDGRPRSAPPRRGPRGRAAPRALRAGLRGAARPRRRRAGDARPAVFLATLGTLAQYTARVVVRDEPLPRRRRRLVEGPGGTDPTRSPRRSAAAGTPVAVLASSDKVYAEHAARGPRAAPTPVPRACPRGLAGRGHHDDDTALTVLYSGCDAAALLRDLLDHLEAGS